MTWFSTRVLSWGQTHGRTDLPWQMERTPYRVWIAEIMLQQTQVATVKLHYARFLRKYPSILTLAESSQDDVLAAWHGLGYYRRAVNIFQTAQLVKREYGGELPKTVAELRKLPGIGKSTAGAIRSLAYKLPAPILDANVRRILSRYHGVNGPPSTHIPDQQLWEIAEQHTPTTHCHIYTQSIMDFGALLCTRSNPACHECPVNTQCIAYDRKQVHCYPATRKLHRKREHKRYLVVLDRDGKCLLQKSYGTGISSYMWDTAELVQDENVKQTLARFSGSFTSGVCLSQFEIKPYSISNKIVSEKVYVAKYTLTASEIGTPPQMAWIAKTALNTIGLSVKTRHRIDIAQTQSTRHV